MKFFSRFFKLSGSLISASSSSPSSASFYSSNLATSAYASFSSSFSFSSFFSSSSSLSSPIDIYKGFLGFAAAGGGLAGYTSPFFISSDSSSVSTPDSTSSSSELFSYLSSPHSIRACNTIGDLHMYS